MSAVDAIRAARLVAILRRADDVDGSVARLADAGVRVVEITLDSDDALGAIERARARGDLTVLAGTVREPEQVQAAVSAGAQGVVGPTLSLPVLERAAALGLPAIPGALTPTEIETARRAGAALVKLFPARVGGPRYVRDVLAPLTDVPLLVTGGVDATNAREFLAAGAVAVGVGSGLGGEDDVRRLLEAVS
ncbi:MAG TPA: bifunctional 4-hydroxy-2-oxoglutarate aldolase/2-dehydro-3-deoxy-phosphogluconate aldolase [Gaiella sp.]|jgi:2-dehydro-3-deoxyphosphogluconate aldolase/(4S)-4-hydroxy-2-oxoglutarate aldolase